MTGAKRQLHLVSLFTSKVTSWTRAILRSKCIADCNLWIVKNGKWLCHTNFIYISVATSSFRYIDQETRAFLHLYWFLQLQKINVLNLLDASRLNAQCTVRTRPEQVKATAELISNMGLMAILMVFSLLYRTDKHINKIRPKIALKR